MRKRTAKRDQKIDTERAVMCCKSKSVVMILASPEILKQNSGQRMGE